MKTKNAKKIVAAVPVAAVPVPVAAVPVAVVPAAVPVAIDLKKEVTAVIAANTALDTAIAKGTTKLNDTATALLTKAGYLVTLTTVHNEAVLKVCKLAIKTALEVTYGAFITRDTEGKAGLAALAYKSISNALQRQSAIGRNGVDGAGQANGAGKITGTRTDKTPETPEPQKAAILRKAGEPANTPDVEPADLAAVCQERKTIKLTGDAAANLEIVYDVSGTPAEIWEKLSLEFLDLIAVTPAIQSDIAFRLGLGK